MRYGGEEFLIILPGASVSNVAGIAEKVRHFVEDTEISHNTQTIKVTVSLGGTSFPEQNVDDFISLIAIAIQRCIRLKHRDGIWRSLIKGRFIIKQFNINIFYRMQTCCRTEPYIK